MKMLRLLLLIVLSVLVATCATMLAKDPNAVPRSTPTLRVRNESTELYSLRLDGHRIGSIPAGQTVCIRLEHLPPPPVNLSIKALSEDAVYVLPVVDYAGESWGMEIGFEPEINVYSLQPAEACK